MTLRTGTSKTGKIHKYYTCSVCARQGKQACKGRSIPMDKLDTLVVDHLVERLFQPERLTEILASAASRRADESAEVGSRVSSLQTEVTGGIAASTPAAPSKPTSVRCNISRGLS